MMGEWGQAEASLRGSLMLGRLYIDNIDESCELYTLGALHFLKRKYKEGLEYFMKSGEIYDTLNEKSGNAAVFLGIGMLHSRQGKISDAASYLEKAISIYRELGDQLSESRVVSEL